MNGERSGNLKPEKSNELARGNLGGLFNGLPLEFLKGGGTNPKGVC